MGETAGCWSVRAVPSRWCGHGRVHRAGVAEATAARLHALIEHELLAASAVREAESLAAAQPWPWSSTAGLTGPADRARRSLVPKVFRLYRNHARGNYPGNHVRHHRHHSGRADRGDQGIWRS